MATIVLSAVGAVVGGPIGAAVGALIGQQVDNVIFAPGRRQGPRLGDLSIQTSSYGSAIPKLFGTVRVSGTVIWATDLKETRTTRSNGKGRGSTDVYSYGASFAVALSGRRISDIGRIWADGKLLRGAAGDFKTETGFRFYVGDEGQALDPLIAATEGIGATPAYRGLAYAVFEDMQLAAYGNRIPTISFEVIADPGGTSAGAVLSGLGAISSDGGPMLIGLAATGDSVRGVTVPGLSGVWRVARVSFEAMVVRLDLVLMAPASLVTPAADPGRNRGQVDLPHGPTTLLVTDLPQLSDVPETVPFVAVAANGASGGWRRAALMTSIDGGATYADAGATAFPTLMGRTVTALAAGPADLIDRVNAVEVQMVHPGLVLADADGDALLGGANLAMIGDEAIQFGRATPLGNGRWRLSELWRGRRGTEWAIAPHAIDSVLVLVEPLGLKRLDSAAAVPSVKVMAVGVGDVLGVVATGPTVVGSATRPLSPVSLHYAAAGADILVGWTRRSREGWAWRDAVDVPLGEESERYRVTKVAAGRPDLVTEVATNAWVYSTAERSSDLAAGAASASVSIQQIGSLGVSRAVTIIIPIN